MPLEEFFPSPPGGVTSPGGRLVDLTQEVTGILPPGMVTPFAQTITVAKTGGDHTTIAAGLLAAAAVATTGNRILVLIYPGDYSEANPLTVADYVSVACIARHEATRMFCLNAAQHGLVIGKDSDIVGLQVRGASGAGKAGFHISGTKEDVELHDCKAWNCDISVLVDSTGKGNTIKEFRISGGAGSVGIKVAAGAEVDLESLTIDAGVVLTSVLEASGAGSVIRAMNIDSRAAAANGAYANSGGLVTANGCSFVNVVNGARCAGANSFIDGTGTKYRGSIWDLVTDDAGAGIAVSADVRRDKISKFPASSLLAVFFDHQTEGDNALHSRAEFHVGSWDDPQESAYGGGDSTTETMETHQYDASTPSGARFTDKTAEAASFSGSTWAFPAGAAVGDAILFAGDWKFPGIKLAIPTLMVAGAAVIVWERWNGATWDVFSVMESNADAGYEGYANHVFVNTNSTQTYFDDAMLAAWAAADNVLDEIPNYGSNKYVVRARITAGVPPTPPVFEQVKLWPSGRIEHNSDGVVQFFGTAEQDVVVQYRQGIDFRKTGGNDPNDKDVLVGPNLTLDGKENRFDDAILMEMSLPTKLPDFTDTSRPIRLRLHAFQDGAAPGNVEFVVELTVISGAVRTLDGTNPVTDSHAVVVVAPNVNLREFDFDFEIDVSSAQPDSDLFFRIYRDARGTNPNDTVAGRIAFHRLDLTFTRYRP